MTATPPMERRRLALLQKAAAWLPPFAGLLGSVGIIVLAANAHLGASSLVETAGTFLLLHAAAVLAMAALARQTPGLLYVFAGLTLAVGTVLFCGELLLAGLFGLRPFPPAAPIGGALLIVGWLTLPLFSLWIAMRNRIVRPRI